MLLPEEHRQRLVESIPFPKRIGRTEEFAALVREIITNEYINGETIRIDGAVRMSPK
jgi:NAD(P)-dependent dehydrogenase (short-subunit alcohol dehydrogenase family)